MRDVARTRVRAEIRSGSEAGVCGSPNSDMSCLEKVCMAGARDSLVRMDGVAAPFEDT